MSLENLLAAKSAIEKEFLNGPHNDFSVGDIVTNGDVVGRVEWIENKALDIPVEDGKMGLNLINGDKGFWGNAKRNNFKKVDPAIEKYLKTKKTITLRLNGEELESIFSSYFGLRNVNPEKTRLYMLDEFEKHRIPLFGSDADE